LTRFVGSKSQGRIGLLGIPMDFTNSFRQGAHLAPQRIRLVSDSIESYCPILDADLEDLDFGDRGDLTIPADPVTALAAIAAAVEEIDYPVLLGGEHLLTLGALRGLSRRHPDLICVQLDAHTDLRHELDGLTLSHATWARRALEEGFDLLQLGVRSGLKEEFALARKHNLLCAAPAEVLARAGNRPVYLSLDIDILDPSIAPGTGNPEAGGPGYLELTGILFALEGLNLVGMDLVEVSPPHDPADLTSLVAAKLLREMILTFWRKFLP